MNSTYINISSSIDKIQEVRALHALSELGVELRVLKSEGFKLEPLSRMFEMTFDTGSGNGHKIEDVIQINHTLPTTSVGSVTKPLIFPKVIFGNLKKKWPDSRAYEYSFAGLMTEERRQAIGNWLELSGFESHGLHRRKSFFSKVENRLSAILKLDRSRIRQIKHLYLWSSRRGRTFPGKSWDQEYYDFLLNSKFALCPSGVYVWTYRFFESIMCGAIPIVEETCPSYDGFIFYNMKDEMSNLEWSQKILDHNYNLCLERLTISEAEIERILEDLNRLNMASNA